MGAWGPPAIVEDVEPEGPAMAAMGEVEGRKAKSSAWASIVLETGLGLKVTLREPLGRSPAAAGSSGELSVVNEDMMWEVV